MIARMKTYMWKAIVFLGSVLPSIAHAQGLKNAGKNLDFIGERAGANTKANLPTVVGNIVSAALTLLGIIFLVLMVYAGYLWMTAQGEEQQIEKAKNIIKSSLIGLVVVVSAYAITTFVTGRLSSL
jgi:cytochrome bd-type quinol oxidase subunit 2